MMRRVLYGAGCAAVAAAVGWVIWLSWQPAGDPEYATDRVRILLADYRDITGQYDAIVSVEMIEAVGLHYWPEFFATLDRLLRPGGCIGLQSITMPHDRMWAAVRPTGRVRSAAWSRSACCLPRRWLSGNGGEGQHRRADRRSRAA
jgi:hypothetical protein